MNPNRQCVTLVIITLILTSCSIINRPEPTPIPEKPFDQMTAEPPVGVAGSDSIGDPYIPTLGNSGYNVQQYDLDITFSNPLDSITATATISSIVTMDNLGRISLDFSGYEVDAVQVGKKYAAYYRNHDKLFVDLPKTYADGKELVMRINYHGQIKYGYSSYAAMAVGLVKPEMDENFIYAFGEPDGAHSWFPCNDHPQDKATYRFELSVPKGLTAIANGTLLQTIQSDSQDTFVWSETAPMASYLAMMAVGNYQRIDEPRNGNVNISYYVIQGDDDYSNVLRKLPDILQFYAELIGPYPFTELGITIIDPKELSESFAEESQTMMIFDQEIMDGINIDYVLAHEVVHQWFGDNVSLASWGEVWLKEGLADYLAIFWLDHKGIATPDLVLGEMEQGILLSGKDQPLNQPLQNDMYGANTYLKGAWVFHMLEQELGDEAFYRFVREYYRRFAGGNAASADLQKVAEEVSGKNLGIFFQQWVYGADNPNLQITWTAQPNNVSVQVCQTGGGQAFTLPLEIQLKAGTGDSILQVIQVDAMQEQVTFSLPFKAVGLVADPEQYVLAKVKVTKVDALTGCAP